MIKKLYTLFFLVLFFIIICAYQAIGQGIPNPFPPPIEWDDSDISLGHELGVFKTRQWVTVVTKSKLEFSGTIFSGDEHQVVIKSDTTPNRYTTVPTYSILAVVWKRELQKKKK